MGISYSVGPGWERLDGELAGAWYFDPANRHTVRGPAGEAAQCATDIVDLAGLDGAATGCAPVVGTATGEVALSISGSVVWLWTADQVLVSGDAGATW